MSISAAVLLLNAVSGAEPADITPMSLAAEPVSSISEMLPTIGIASKAGLRQV